MKARKLTEAQISCLERFAAFEVSLEELRRCLGSLVSFDFEAADGTRWMETHFEPPEPGVMITKGHVDRALTLRKNAVITEEQLIEWATMILHNLAYHIDEKDEDFIAQWLNDISFDLKPFEE